MKKIANILTLSKIDNNLLYNIVDNKEKLIKGIPTLCIGVDFAKKNYPLFNIIDFKIDDFTYWTYGPREKRNRYESDLSKFSELSIKKYIENIKYEYVNVIVDGIKSETLKRIKEIILNGKFVFYLNNGMIYINDNVFKKVYGISLREMEYCSLDYKPFLSKLYKNGTVITNKDISLEIRSMFYDTLYIIPSLF